MFPKSTHTHTHKFYTKRDQSKQYKPSVIALKYINHYLRICVNTATHETTHNQFIMISLFMIFPHIKRSVYPGRM